MNASYFDEHTRSRVSPWKRATLLGFALGAQLFIANEAAAQAACGDSTCAKGFSCQTIGGACPAIDCGDSANCPPCEPQEYSVCVPAACSSDAECGADQVCAEQIVYDCPPTIPTSACRPGEECVEADRAAPTCEPSTVSYCTPRWQLPCTVAADCGAGFDCIEQERCSASGSPGSPGTGSGSAGTPTPGNTPGTEPSPPSDDAAQLPAPPSTTCEPSGYSVCVPREVACNADADCLSGWTCQANPDGVCWSGPEGEGCQPADPAKICVPPYYGGGSRGDAPPGVATSGTDEGNASSGPPNTAGPTVPENPQAQPGTALPTPDAAGELAGVNDSGGCSMSASPSSTGGLAWLALGLAGVFGLRRRR